MTTRKQVKDKVDETKTSRRARDYGLPPLTFDEAALVLDISPGEFKVWVMERVEPSKEQWSLWVNTKRELPEAVIRLYLMSRRDKEIAYQRQLREVVKQRDAIEAAKNAPPAIAQPTEKKRAAGGRR